MSAPNQYQRVLGIDTAGPALAVGLIDGCDDVADIAGDIPFEHSRRLVVTIGAALRKAGWQPSYIDLIAVTAGPGSYTGLRLGATAAKVFGWAVGAPLVGVDALDVLAGNLEQGTAAARADQPSWAVAMTTARRGEVYARLYRLQPGNSLQPVTKLLEGRLETVIGLLRPAVASAPGDVPIWLIGEGARRHAEVLESALGAGICRWVDPALDVPRGTVVARLGQRVAAAGAVQAAVDFVPEYVGPAIV